MTKKEVIARLHALGTAQNRKTYGRHGVTGRMYGVSYAEINKIAKKIKTDHSLAESLWETGNHDARILATYIADPSAMKSSRIDAWAKGLDNYVLVEALSKLVARTVFAEKKAEKWSRAKSEWLGQLGWSLVASLALRDDSKSNAWFVEKLRVIEAEVHARPNRTRYSMNNALIAIGIRNAALEKRAVAAAKRIGKVEVDHGDTSCRTPDAIAYIEKVKARRKKRGA